MSQAAFKHQDFSIDQVARKKVIRQDRFYPETKHSVFFKNKEFAVNNYSSFGLALNNFDLAGEIFEGIYRVDNIELCDVKLRLTRQDKNSSGSAIVAFAIEGMPLPIEAIHATEAVKTSISDFENKIILFNAVPTAFKDRVHEFESWIESLEREITKIEKSSFDATKRNLEQFEEAVCQYVSYYLMAKVHEFSLAMGTTLNGIDSERIKKSYEYLREKVGHIFYKSPYGNRAFAKPRGYAGDYEMMNNVYFNELRGNSLFAKAVQRYFTDNPASRAVRNRAIYLNQKIKEATNGKDKIKILGVASGPAREIQKLYSDNPDLALKCEIHLLDQDVDALKFSQRDILEICRSKNLKPNIYFHNLAIKNVINEGTPEKDFDLIYSAGLFDYFTDPVANFAAQQLYKALTKGGKLVIGNFNTNNPAQFVMEALGDWYLIYRDENQIMNLFKNITSKLTIEKEAENINLFAVMEK